MSNPFFTERTTKNKAIPFDIIKLEHYMPAIEKGLADTYKNIEILKANTATPNFENTIIALETAGADLDDPVEIYFTLYSTESDNDFKALVQQISPLLSKLSSDISTDAVIFQKVKQVYDNRAKENLTAEQIRLLEKTYKGFVRNGALLDEQKKEELKQIDQELSLLSPQFSKNVLDATNAYSYHTTDKAEIEGLPENDVKAAEARAKQKGHSEGWLFNLQAPSYVPAMTYLKNRDLRKKISTAYATRAFNDSFDNQETLLKEVNLRYKRANLLGYKTHAHYVLEERMAENPETVEQFLERIYKIAMPVAKKEVEEVKAYAKKIDNIDELQTWDSAYYSEKLKKEKFGFDSDELRPYFKVENCVQGIFKVAENLYGLKFEKSTEYPVYHPNVEVFEVFDIDKSYLGLLYVDLFPRETKNGGAWMNAMQTQGMRKGKIERPHIMIVGNFTPSTETTPSLLSLSEVETLFHEFGHALHGLLSNCTYTALASPNVYWDFVELPSQIMENWVLEEETLALFAFHHKTGEVLPKELLTKVKASQNYNKGMFNIRQLNFGMLDMSWHSVDPSNIKNVAEYEDKMTEKL
ncbi:MAG: M3 family metallopeptidase, partial [Candidatus Cloacimonetes bacterium]|nr:M3 family metallopeptidase [Candidatus Cloacimonadota bacterium]